MITKNQTGNIVTNIFVQTVIITGTTGITGTVG